VEVERPAKPQRSELEEASRKLTSLMNKVTPETMGKMAKQIAELCGDDAVASKLGDRLLFFAGMFTQYAETYADLCVELLTTIPPAAAATLRADITAATRNPAPSAAALEDHKKTHMARSKFVGNLFVRGVVKLQDLDGYMGVLLGAGSGAAAECAVQVLKATGVSLEGTEAAREKLHEWSDALVAGKEAQPKRVQFLIEDVVALANRGWSYRCFDESPQTVDSLHAKHHRDTWGGIVVAPVFENKVAGSPTAKCIAA
jgi:NADPH:quinone reductase-like Zn-dependent oxidoreductase